MKRVHFIEIEDEPWCPPPIRDAATDYLQFVVEKTNPFAVVAKKLGDAVIAAGSNSVVDLCSGGGGAWRCLIPAMIQQNPGLKVRLTDKYPNQKAFRGLAEDFPEIVSFSADEIDAQQVPENLPGFRTMFNSFHHFRPDEARRILQNAVWNNEGIAVFEFTQRRAAAILAMLLTPLIVLVVTPFIRPFRASRLIFTYLFPLIPLLVVFDGIVSCLRTYTISEMQSMTEELSSKYRWEIGEIPVKGSIVPVSFLIGYPDPDTK